MSGHEDEKIFALMEQAEALQEAAKSQQEAASAQIAEAVRAVRYVRDALPEKVAAAVTAAVADSTAKATARQLERLTEATLSAERAAIASMGDVKDKILLGFALVVLAGVLGLALVYAGTRWTYRAVTAEREEFRHELSGIKQEIADAREALKGLEEKTWGIRLLEQDGKRYAVFADGYSLGRTDLELPQEGKKQALKVIEIVHKK